MTKQTNTAYTVFLGGDTGPTHFSSNALLTAAGNPTDGVYVMNKGDTTAYQYDDPGTLGTNECSNVS